MNVDISTSIVINRARELVSRYAANPDHAPEWYVNIKAVEWKTAPPVAIGSRIAFVAHFLGRRMAYTYEVVDLVPGERLLMRTAEAPFPMETTYIWETTSDGGTRMTLRNRGTPAGFSNGSPLFWPVRCGAPIERTSPNSRCTSNRRQTTRDPWPGDGHVTRRAARHRTDR